MRKLFLISGLITCWNCSMAQWSTDAVSVFKMHLFLDRDNIRVTRDSITRKNDSLYMAFCQTISLKLDTLEIKGDFNFTKSVFAPKFQFYFVESGDGTHLNYTRKLIGTEAQYFGIASGVFSKYVLAINQKTGRSYRIIGFNGNDFLSFLSDYLEYFNDRNTNKVTANTFLRNYQVNGIDLKCLYKGLRAKSRDDAKFPCLKRVDDPITIH
ncbi:MAG: hypothetical protein EOP48_07765 [Sphingobacteriales bacterium]|nr:MAG: hypothetical protein EOP48_07765 [Sphingobacteriales bacterium]